MAPLCRRPRSPPTLTEMEDPVEEILLRIPPDEPADLFRAALVCKPWRRIILSGHDFLRRYRAFHQSPPLLGFLHNLYLYGEGPIPSFVSTTTASLSPPALSGYRWALDCRHGRVLINSSPAGVAEHLVVWDPISGDMKQLIKPLPDVSCAGAVMCAVDGCDHLDCHAGPFLVVCVGTVDSDDGYETWASMYSSETGVWSPSVSIDAIDNVEGKPSLLIGDALYFTLENGVLKYDMMGRHELVEIEPPGVCGSIYTEVEDGELGFVAELDNCIYKWLWQANSDGTGRWEKHMVMELETVLPTPVCCTSY